MEFNSGFKGLMCVRKYTNWSFKLKHAPSPTRDMRINEHATSSCDTFF